MPKKRKSKRGPDEERLILSGSWKSNIKRAITKKRPKTGWPKRSKSK